MSVVKKNTYVTGDNSTVTNLVSNTPVFGFDKTFIQYSAPNILIKVGSMVECNGNLYAVEGSDVSLTAANGNLTFNSNTLTFAISSSAYSYDNLKRGDYIDANTRVLRFRINSSGQYDFRRDSIFTIPSKRKIVYGSWANLTEYNSFIDSLSNLFPTGFEKYRVSGIGNISYAVGSNGYFIQFYFSRLEKINNKVLFFGYVKKTFVTGWGVAITITYESINYDPNSYSQVYIYIVEGSCAVEIP